MRHKFTVKIKRWLSAKIPLIIITLLIIIMIVVFFWHRIVITVASGEAGVMYYRLFGGTVTDRVYSEGIYIIFPWDKLTLYNVRIQTTLHDFEVLTNRGLPINLRLAIRFRPEYELLGVLHQQVGPNYFDTIIIPEVESVLRKHIGHYNPEDIYINKEGILTEIIVSALEELGQKYVNITDVIIRAVHLPDDVKEAIETKLVEEQHFQAYVFKLKREQQEAERMKIEAKGIHEYHEIIKQSLDSQLLTWQGIKATLTLAQSDNAKVVVFGNSDANGLPIIGNIPLHQKGPKNKK